MQIPTAKHWINIMMGVIGTTSFPAVVENMMTMTSNLKPCVVLVKVHRNTEMIIYQIYCNSIIFLNSFL